MVRFRAPYADPVLIPAVALLNGLGVAFLRRLDLAEAPAAERAELPDLRRHGRPPARLDAGRGRPAPRSSCWCVRDHRSISRYAYTLGLVGIVLVLIPALLPGSISEVNGAKLWIKFGGFSIQPGEFAKLALLAFFAYYLVRKREVLSLASRRFLGIDFPRGRDLGPVLAVWAAQPAGPGLREGPRHLAALLRHVRGHALRRHRAGQLADHRSAAVLRRRVRRLPARRVGRWSRSPTSTTARDDLARPVRRPATNEGYQLVPVAARAGHRRPVRRRVRAPASRPSVPEVRNDFIFAGMGEEIGLFGLSALLVIYLLIVERGLRAGLAVRDSFGKLLAGGLAFTLGLQVFVIVGGISKLIPLTGQTTPFLSAGGSSLMANWLLIAMLLRISDAARRPVDGSVRRGRAVRQRARPRSCTGRRRR